MSQQTNKAHLHGLLLALFVWLLPLLLLESCGCLVKTKEAIPVEQSEERKKTREKLTTEAFSSLDASTSEATPPEFTSEAKTREPAPDLRPTEARPENPAPEKGCSAQYIRCKPARVRWLYKRPACDPGKGRDSCYKFTGMAIDRQGIVFGMVQRKYRKLGSSRIGENFTWTSAVNWDGSLRFKEKAGSPRFYGARYLVPPDHDEYIIRVMSYTHPGYPDTDKVSFLDPSTGLPVKGTNHLYLPSTPFREAYLRQKRYLIRAEVDGRIAAYSLGNSQPVWSYTLKGKPVSAPSIDKDGNIYICTADGALLSLSPEGKLRWSQKKLLAEKSYKNVSITGTGLLVVHGSYTHMFNVEGKHLWKKDIWRTNQSGVRLLPDGGSWSYRVAAFQRWDKQGNKIGKRTGNNSGFSRHSLFLLPDGSLGSLNAGLVSRIDWKTGAYSREIFYPWGTEENKETVAMLTPTGPGYPSRSTVFEWKGKLYHLVQIGRGNDATIGILEVELPNATLMKKGWSILQGNVHNTRQVLE